MFTMLTWVIWPGWAVIHNIYCLYIAALCGGLAICYCRVYCGSRSTNVYPKINRFIIIIAASLLTGHVWPQSSPPPSKKSSPINCLIVVPMRINTRCRYSWITVPLELPWWWSFFVLSTKNKTLTRAWSPKCNLITGRPLICGMRTQHKSVPIPLTYRTLRVCSSVYWPELSEQWNVSCCHWPSLPYSGHSLWGGLMFAAVTHTLRRRRAVSGP